MELVIVELRSPLFLSFLVLFFSLLIWLKRAKRSPKLNLPPSPPKLPIIGNIRQLGKLPHHSLRDLSNKYGSILLLQMGHNPTVVISSAEIVRDIVKNHDIVFFGRPRTTAADTLLYGRKNMGFAEYGKYWRRVRKVSFRELFSVPSVHSLQFVREEETEALINKIRGASEMGESINLSKMLMSIQNNIVSRCVASQRSEGEDGSNKLGQSLRKLLALLLSFSVGDMFPYLKWMDVLTGLIPRMKAASREVDLLLDEMIEEHRALKNHKGIKKDFISMILQLQRDSSLEISQDNIKAILQDIFLGGTETTAATTEWLMAELIKHPNVMKKVQKEVRNVVGNKSKVDVDDIPKMEYLKCVIKETFRLHPPAPLLPPRKTSASVKLGGYDIPSNITVYVNAFAIQRDPKWWDMPEEFIPERFENSPIDYDDKEHFHYIPFGFGRRACPGTLFGVASVENVIANLLCWFDWKLPVGEVADELDMSEIHGMVVHKKVPLNVLPISRSSI